MKTTVENLLKIKGSELQTSEKIDLVFIYKNDKNHIKIYYKFYKNFKLEPDAWVRENDDHVVEIHFFEEIEDVMDQVYYITGENIQIE